MEIVSTRYKFTFKTPDGGIFNLEANGASELAALESLALALEDIQKQIKKGLS